MTSKLPINLDDLLRQRTVEGERIEYKSGWNPAPIMRTLCAFANDIENLGGGYIIIGQDCEANGQPIFPPKGLANAEIEMIQQELIRYCNQINPPYFPKLAVATCEGKTLIVLWAPGGANRAYQVPSDVTAKHKTYHYYIRRYSSTIEARGEDERELISLTANVPFDDRVCQRATVEDLRLPLIRAYLKEIKSGLYDESASLSLNDLSRQMNIVDGGDEHMSPRNVGILFFNEAPESFFPGTQIDVVSFPKGAGGGEIIEQTFRGPIDQQIRDALRYIRNNVLQERVTKFSDKAEAERVFNYPYAAIEEAVVNAMYHRGYDQREPVEVRINPDSIEIVSYPGADRSIKEDLLNDDRVVSRRYRNRRVGEFLKELELTEGRSTGVPTIRRELAANGSPQAVFSTDPDRTYFLVEFPIHPAFMTPEVTPQVSPQVTPQVEGKNTVLTVLYGGDLSTREIQDALGVADRKHFRTAYLLPALNSGLVEMTIPDKPQSSKQRYRLTPKGKKLAKEGGGLK